MGLPLPKEPKDIKEFIKSVRAGMGGDSLNIDYDSLSTWSFNRLPKYLWGYWKDDLKGEGITWQRFLKILKLHTIDMVGWALYDRLEWVELIKKIEISIGNYSRRVK